MQELKKNIYVRLNLLNSLRKTLSKINNDDILPEILVQEKILTTKDLVLKKTYKAVLREASAKKKCENDEIVILETGENEELCPLTKKVIVDRFVSTCGHVFEKSALEKLLKGNKHVKCPVQGCDKRLIK